MPPAIPARCGGAASTAAAETALRARANPRPTTATGAAMSATDIVDAGTAAAQKQPTAMRPNPVTIVQRAPQRSMRCETGRAKTRVEPLSSTNAMDVVSGEKPWMADNRMLEE